MKKRRTLVVALLLVAVLALGIGYAAISDVILTITGTGDLATSSENFKVVFTNPTSDDAATISVDGVATNASIAVTGLVTTGDKATVTIDILNDDVAGSMYAAQITEIELTQDTENYFKATVVNEDAVKAARLEPGQKITVEIEVELLKIPANPGDTYTGHFVIDFTAAPQAAAVTPDEP